MSNCKKSTNNGATWTDIENSTVSAQNKRAQESNKVIRDRL